MVLLWAVWGIAAEVQPEDWLVLGPVARPLPAFVEEPELAALLEGDSGLGPEPLWPVAGERVRLAGGPVSWQEQSAKKGSLQLPNPDGPEVAWAATTIRTDGYTEASLSLRSSSPVRVWVDGETIVTTDGQSKGDEPAEGTVPLTPGVHRLLLQTAASEGRWRVELSVDGGERALELEPAPQRPVSLDALLHAPRIEALATHPDGSRFAVQLVTPAVPSEHRTRWTEIRDASTGELVRRLEADVGSFSWSVEGDRYAYRTAEDGGSTLWVGREGESPRRLLRGEAHLGGFTWLPGDAGLVFSRGSEPDDDGEGIRRLTSTVDRWPWGRDHSTLHQVSLDGATRQLTGGDDSWNLLDVHPDGGRLLVSRSEHDTAERPFGREHVHELELSTLTSEEVLVSGYFDGATYRPDGEAILLQGGPSMVDGGAAVPEGITPNEYDRQLYLWTRADTEVRPLTRDFDPTIQGAWWHGEQLLVTAQAGPFTRLYDMSLSTGEAVMRATLGDVVAQVAPARAAERVVYVASGAATPPAIFTEDRVLHQPGAGLWEAITLGEVTDFDVTHEGTRLQGRVHFPPDYDPDGSYPVIVNYYGGTSPVSRSFGGRYPANWWAAHGYLVYILQPSGATGFGQEFSARHVNDWSKTTADEVMAATEAFLEAHPAADPERVGCIGASYGGFLTMRLATRSEQFGAAISHAGISNIAAYWGEGWWGHLYSALATADSYPWNAREIYVEESPLFHADAIETPLLLLHGTADMNVPLGESDSMFTALKVLGKDVEYIQYDGEGHWILDYPKRRQWHATILAYFDWKLSGDDAWWTALYPEDE